MVLKPEIGKNIKNVKLVDPSETFRTVLCTSKKIRLPGGTPLQERVVGNFKHIFF